MNINIHVLHRCVELEPVTVTDTFSSLSPEVIVKANWLKLKLCIYIISDYLRLQDNCYRGLEKFTLASSCLPMHSIHRNCSLQVTSVTVVAIHFRSVTV